MTTEPLTLTLAAFVSARLDDDEAVARKAIAIVPWSDSSWVVTGRDSVMSLPNTFAIATTPAEITAAHIARHDPARVLADVKAKRAMLMIHEPGLSPGCSPRDSAFLHPDDCITLRLLALPYRDHPDWREEWAG